MTVDVRPQIVVWADWCVTHKDLFNYRQVRPMPYSTKAPIDNDCSGTFTLCYYLAGAPDPNGLGYDGYGYTGTLATHGQQITQAQLEPGDAVIYYGGGFAPGDSQHVATIIKPGPDPLTMSHGQQSEPAYVTVSEDGRPHQYFRYATNSRFPPPPKPPVPLAADLYAARHGMVHIDRAEALLAIHAGISYYVWKGKMVGSRSAKVPTGVALFAFKANLDAAHIPHGSP